MNAAPFNSSHECSRRRFLYEAGGGFGAVAAVAMLAGERKAIADSGSSAALSTSPLMARPAHVVPRATRVIYLFMHGGPSQVDLFDPKPDLIRQAGSPLPETFGKVMTRRKVAANPLLGPVKPFRPRGESGLEISDFLPEIAQHADDLCVLRSCHGDSVNHPQSVYQMNTGSILMGRPSLGSWVAYGLGTENQDLPAFVVLPDPGGGIKGGPPAWSSGYLPASFQGTIVRPGTTPILNLNRSESLTESQQRRVLDLTQRLNHRHWQEHGLVDEFAARIASYELAYRMQSAAPEAVDLKQETAETQKLYGLDDSKTAEFGTRCLLARRLAERGVRFIQLYSGDTNGWDAHNDVLNNHTEMCRRTDGPISGLLTDLKRRGLWDDTLVIWGGEFGRMPMSEQGKGRDHNPWGYSVWLAGGAVKGGMAHGSTDEFGLRATEHPVHVHDLHATILHILGLNHEQLTFFHEGREQRLTDVAGKVVASILA